MRHKRDPSLYATEEEVAEIVLGPGHVRDWREKAVLLEREGLPKIDPLMGGRYLPAVRVFFDRRNGIAAGNTSLKVDGPEKWPKQKPRPTPKPSTSTPPASNGETEQEGNVFPFGSPPKKP